MRISIIIATDNRAGPLNECLESLSRQSVLPDEVIIAHSGSDDGTAELIQTWGDAASRKIKFTYLNCFPFIGAAAQRNIGADKSSGHVLCFLDDDVVLEADFISEIMTVFEKDFGRKIGGVGGTIVNTSYVPLSKMNKRLFDLCLHKDERDLEYAGKVVGPAVNFWPSLSLRKDTTQRVHWICSACAAFRRDVLMKYKFNEKFKGYSFMEDVDLSLRIGKEYLLMIASKARCFHKDLGGKTHKNWIKIGESQVLNRWHVMVNVLGKNKFGDKCKFFYYQLYCVFSEARSLLRWSEVKNTLSRWLGRFFGLWKILVRNHPFV